MPTPADKDACELLDADHLAVKHLFVEYARLAMAMPVESAGERRALADKICNELTVHAQIEEEIFYPALRSAVADSADVVDQGIQEHQEAKDLIAQIRGADAADADQDRLVSELARVVEHHVKEERDELFPKAKAAPGVDMADIGAQLRKRQQELLVQLAA